MKSQMICEKVKLVVLEIKERTCNSDFGWQKGKSAISSQRVSPSRKAVDFRRRILIRMRLLISEKSHVLYDEAIRKDDLKVFIMVCHCH